MKQLENRNRKVKYQKLKNNNEITDRKAYEMAKKIIGKDIKNKKESFGMFSSKNKFGSGKLGNQAYATDTILESGKIYEFENLEILGDIKINISGDASYIGIIVKDTFTMEGYPQIIWESDNLKYNFNKEELNFATISKKKNNGDKYNGCIYIEAKNIKMSNNSRIINKEGYVLIKTIDSVGLHQTKINSKLFNIIYV
jgi:hypothetical protein